jgi:hypothetical protein
MHGKWISVNTAFRKETTRSASSREEGRRFTRLSGATPAGGNAVIVEMRTYRTKPGLRSRFLEIFKTRSMPAHAEIGMTIVGPFLSVDDPDTFFFMRAFPNPASREPMKAAFYEGELWKRELESVLMPMLDQYDVVVVDDEDELRPLCGIRNAAESPDDVR